MKPFIKRIICLILIVPILNINWTETSFAKAPKVLNFGTQKEYYSIDFESYHYQFRKLYGRSFRLPYKKYMEKKYKIYFSDPNLSVKNIKSSNPEVLEQNHPDYDEYGNIDFYMNKAGKATVTGDIYYNDEFFRSFKYKYIIYNYKNPFKKLDIGKISFRMNFDEKASSSDYVARPNDKKAVMKKTDENGYAYVNLKPLKGKLKCKLKKGFKLKKITIKGGKYKKKTKIKNGVKLKLKTYSFKKMLKTYLNEGGYNLAFTIYDKKHKMNYEYRLFLDRNNIRYIA